MSNNDPLKNLKAFDIREDMIVADLGAGSGFYTLACAHLVAHGKVYAVEVQKDFVITLQTKIKEQHLKNVECLWGDIEKIGGTKLGEHIVDRVIASNVLFQVEDKDNFVKEIKRILKRGGKVLVIDWSLATSSMAPAHLAMSKKDTRELFEQYGFIYEKDIYPSEQHYGMIFKVE